MANPALARYLAVDYGRKRIGLAISDPLGIIASPAGFIARREVACLLARAVTFRSRHKLSTFTLPASAVLLVNRCL